MKKWTVLFIAMFLVFWAVNSSWAWSFKSASSAEDDPDTMILELKDPKISPELFGIKVRLELSLKSKNKFLNYFGARKVSDLEGLDRGLITNPPPESVKLLDKLIEEVIELEERIKKNIAQGSMA